MSDLKTLRKKILEIDNEIVRLIGKRLNLAEEIGREKRALDIPLRNYRIEKEVIIHAQKQADMNNINRKFIKELMELLISESRIRQEKLHYTAYKGDRERILIIGGLGEMGQWFARFFENQGHRVYIYDTKQNEQKDNFFDSLEEGIKNADSVLIATPLDTVGEIIDRITELKFCGVVFDIASIKAHLIDAIKRAQNRGIAITSIHPMFGPDCRILTDRVICLCDCGSEDANQKIETFFKDTAVSLIHLSLKEHDRIISYVLALSHLINLIFIKVLQEGGDYKNFRKVGSTTFFSQLRTTRSVINKNPELCYAIQQLNPFKYELYNSLKSTIEKVAEMVLSKNKKRFIEIMERARRWSVE